MAVAVPAVEHVARAELKSRRIHTFPHWHMPVNPFEIGNGTSLLRGSGINIISRSLCHGNTSVSSQFLSRPFRYTSEEVFIGAVENNLRGRSMIWPLHRRRTDGI